MTFRVLRTLVSVVAMGLSLAPFCYAKKASFLDNSRPVMPKLVETQKRIWPDMYKPHLLAGQIEQETGGTWSGKAELKTSREYGFGIGQITIAYNADRSERFNNFKVVKGMSAELKNWKWEDRYVISYQLVALVTMDKQYLNSLKLPASTKPDDKIAFMYASYNGGVGGVIVERKLCKTKSWCDNTVWFKNVELTSPKSKAKYKGYGKSFYEINREYVQNILNIRSLKYQPLYYSY